MIRRAVPTDVPHILEIADASPESSQWPLEEYERIVAQTDATQACLVGVTEGGILGFIVIRTVADEVEILNLAVAPQGRRQGIASALLRHAIADAAKRNVRRAFLEVRASNLAAIAFYERHGFARSGVRRSYYTSPREDALVLSRLIEQDF